MEERVWRRLRRGGGVVCGGVLERRKWKIGEVGRK